jgi:hypothetical protein
MSEARLSLTLGEEEKKELDLAEGSIGRWTGVVETARLSVRAECLDELLDVYSVWSASWSGPR